MDLTGSFAFTISDKKLDFDEINRYICIIPTKIINKGQVLVSNKVAPFDIWSYEIKISNETDALEHLSYLLDKLMPYSIYIKEISRRYNQVAINCFLRSDMGQIGFEITSEVMHKLNNIGTSMNFHILSYGCVE